MVYLGRIIFIRKHVGIKRKEGAGLVDKTNGRRCYPEGCFANLQDFYSVWITAKIIPLACRKFNFARAINLNGSKERGAPPVSNFITTFTLCVIFGLFVELLEMSSKINC